MRQVENTCHGHDYIENVFAVCMFQFSVNDPLEIPLCMQVIASYESIYFHFHKSNILFCNVCFVLFICGSDLVKKTEPANNYVCPNRIADVCCDTAGILD